MAINSSPRKGRHGTIAIDRDAEKRKLGMEPGRESIRLLLHPMPPFRLDWTVWVLRRRSFNAVDQWNGSTYRRAVVIQGKPALVAISQPKRALEVTVTEKRCLRMPVSRDETSLLSNNF